MDRKKFVWYHRFISGGIGDCSAACFSHPLDLIKVRLQILGEGQKGSSTVPKGAVLRTFRSIIRAEGFGGIYRGISASLLRQATFSSMRHGLFSVFLHHSKTDNTLFRVLGGCLCGAFSAFIANPTDVILIRMQADGAFEPQHRRNYRHVFHGIHTVASSEYLSKLWIGCGPTVFRAMLVTASQCVTYFKVKPWLLSYGFEDNFGVHLTSAISSAVVAVLVTNPVDVIKTRMMNMKFDSYSGPLNCLLQSIRVEGVLCLYKGLLPTTLRLGPHTVILFLIQERVQRFLEKRHNDSCQ